VAESSCRSLYAHYQHETARIPYPADLPLRTLLPMGAKILGRYRLPADDAVCVALMRSMLGRFFVRRTGPGIGVGGRTYGKK